jgi:hypothetical protein
MRLCNGAMLDIVGKKPCLMSALRASIAGYRFTTMGNRQDRPLLRQCDEVDMPCKGRR